MAQTVQQYFVQITVQKGRIMQNDDGTTEKIIDETPMDDVFCKADEQAVGLLVDDIRLLTPQLE